MAGSSALLAKVDAILEKSRKFKSDPKEPDWHKSIPKAEDPGTPHFDGTPARITVAGTSSNLKSIANKSKIFAAMMDRPELAKQSDASNVYDHQQEAGQPLKGGSSQSVNMYSADIASLAARYSSNIDTTMNISYKQKVELEELESRRNDLKLKTEILEKRLNAESQKLTEREISLSKVEYCLLRLLLSANRSQGVYHIYRLS